MTIETISQAMSAVPWDSLTWSYKSCSFEKLRTMFTNMFQADADQRYTAAQILENYCAVQCSLSEAAFYLIPFVHQGMLCRLDQAESPLNLFTSLANSLSPSNSTRVRYKVRHEPFLHFIPDAQGIELFLDHACQTALAGILPTIVDQFARLNEKAQIEAIEFLTSTTHHAFTAQCMLELRCLPHLSSKVLNHFQNWLRDPLYEKIVAELL
ncbi:MAG: hypothetical protein NTY98_05730 [Verrucomicrobia bacterium]|nr:hypothetical protein [Verrucomicrobiota bacterium]